MNTTNMSFRPTKQLKDSIKFIADYEGTSLNQVIIENLESAINEKKEDIKRLMYFHEKAIKNYKDYKKNGKFVTLKDL